MQTTGDFNIHLVNFANDRNTGTFYDLLCTHNFRPLILQTTRVISRTASLVDNIFINDISCYSLGGNITSSICDYFRFCHTDIFGGAKYKERFKYARNFRNFNEREFQEELLNIDWSEIVNEIEGTEECYQNFYRKLEEILDFMAPYRRLSQREIKLRQMLIARS